MQLNIDHLKKYRHTSLSVILMLKISKKKYLQIKNQKFIIVNYWIFMLYYIIFLCCHKYIPNVVVIYSHRLDLEASTSSNFTKKELETIPQEHNLEFYENTIL
jgi:hypothetical protein